VGDHERTALNDAGQLHRVFVYGSLRRGEENHELWFGSGAVHIADGRIHGAELVNLGDYCCVVPTADATSTVIGEVYDVTAAVFQGIEGMEADAGYVRRRVQVQCDSSGEPGTLLDADAYFFARPERVTRYPRVESGDWTQCAERRR
jgi:gamma-glutamylcyclotransferase (GGCT)/AIG2-like uncharacterized protein YtfP